MKQKKWNIIFYYCIASAIGWTLVLATLLTWNISEAKKQMTTQATIQTRTFFYEFLVTRFWNAMHGGLYVPITEETQPNPYLDDPLRDVTTLEGLKLTKINPAYMTRQVAEISASKGTLRFHITSLDPINPGNKADPWEKEALRTFLSGSSEQYELLQSDSGEMKFKYMAPLRFEEPCLECHAQYAAAEGELSGGISITMLADSLVSSRDQQISLLNLVFFCLWLLGLASIGFICVQLRRQENKRETIIRNLEEALAEVKKLSGLLPICCSCKKIRDDKGYWRTLEKYITERSEAQFSHGLCRECAHKLYPEVMEHIESKSK